MSVGADSLEQATAGLVESLREAGALGGAEAVGLGAVVLARQLDRDPSAAGLWSRWQAAVADLRRLLPAAEGDALDALIAQLQALPLEGDESG